MTDKLDFLRRLNLFDEMDEGEIAEISRLLHMREVAAGQVAGGDPGRVYLLKAGRLRLFRRNPDGDELTTATLVPGQLFGLAALNGGSEEGSSAEALENSVICDAGAQDFVRLLGRHPLLMAKVMVAMARQIFRLEQTMESLVLDRLSERLARLLLGWFEDAEHREDGELLPPHTQAEMAKLVAGSRESVARTLGAWRVEGILRTEGRRILVLDRRALEEKAWREVGGRGLEEGAR
jgi:CRP/FNR family cyclic AMP-dependent transcriptional regulator